MTETEMQARIAELEEEVRKLKLELGDGDAMTSEEYAQVLEARKSMTLKVFAQLADDDGQWEGSKIAIGLRQSKTPENVRAMLDELYKMMVKRDWVSA